MVGIRSICEFPIVDIFYGAPIDDDITIWGFLRRFQMGTFYLCVHEVYYVTKLLNCWTLIYITFKSYF